MSTVQDLEFHSNLVIMHALCVSSSVWSSNKVIPEMHSTIPLDMVFIKNRLDLMTATAWLRQDHSLEANVRGPDWAYDYIIGQ